VPFELPPAPEYSRGLEFTLNLLLRGIDPARKLLLSRRMQEVFQHVERQALVELGAERERAG
jgi:hypothetical protein